jgi:glycerate kinase
VYDEGIDAYFSICDGPMSLDEAMANASTLLTSAAANVVRLHRPAR